MEKFKEFHDMIKFVAAELAILAIIAIGCLIKINL